MSLNPRQARFLELMLTGTRSATQAYVEAGYSPNGAAQSASVLLTNHEIAAALKGSLDKAAFNRDEAVGTLAAIVRADLKGLVDEKGVPRPLEQIPEELRRALGGVEFGVVQVEGEEPRYFLKKVKRDDRLRALELMARMSGWLAPEKVEVTGLTDEQIAARLGPLLASMAKRGK